MTEQDLIALVQERLPEELTEAQIQELRSAMRTSPAVREALLHEVQLEQALAGQFAPPPGDFQMLMQRLQGRIDQDGRGRSWLKGLPFLALGLAALVIGIMTAARTWRPSRHAWHVPAAPTTAPAGRAPAQATLPEPASHAATPASTEPAATTEPSFAAAPPTDVPAGDATPEPDDDAPPPATLPASGPAVSRALIVLYARSPGPTSEWELRLARLLSPAPALEQDRRSVRLRAHKLLALPKPDRMLRLHLHARTFALNLSEAQAGARIELAGDGYLYGYVTSRHPQRRILAARQRGDWLSDRHGIVDVRWQNGELILARGDVPMLRLPLVQPPVEGAIQAEASASYMDYLPCKPLELPSGLADGGVRKAADLEWKARAPGRSALARGDDGSMELSSAEPATEASAAMTASWGPGLDVEMQIAGVAGSAGLFVGDASDTQARTCYKLPVIEQAGQTTLGRGGRDGWDALAMPTTFWVRWRYGIDSVQVWIGPDGRYWALLGIAQLDPDRITPVQFGVYLPSSPQKRSIRVVQVRTRAWEAIGRIAAAGVPATAPASVTRPAPWQRWVADRLAALSRPASFKARVWAVQEALQLAASQPEHGPQIVEALSETMMLLSPMTKNEERAWLALCCSQAAQASISSDDCGRIDELARAIAEAPGVVGRMPPGAATFPDGVVRHHLLALASQRKWPQLLVAAGRYQAVGGMPTDPLREDGPTAVLVGWAMNEARLALGEMIASESGAKFLPPLVVEVENEAAMLMAEFDASLRAGEKESAIELLAGRTLPGGLIAAPGDEQLLLPVYLAVREQLRARPDLQHILRDKYEARASLRLQRAQRDGDAEAVAAVAAQFHGTAAATGAMVLIADRDLTCGDFVAAAAMAGEEAGEAVKQDVILPNGRISASEFEATVARLLRGRGARPDGSSAGPLVGPPPGEFTAVAPTGKNISPDDACGFAASAGRAFLASRSEVTCMDGRGATLWSKAASSKAREMSAANPLVIGKRLILRQNLGRGEEVACFDASTGETLWHRAFDDGMVGEAVSTRGCVYILTRRMQGGAQELLFRRISPESGRPTWPSPWRHSATNRPGHRDVRLSWGIWCWSLRAARQCASTSRANSAGRGG